MKESIISLLALFPRGLDDRLLLWRLRRAGARVEPQELLAALTSLAETGQVRRVAGRWLLAEFDISPSGRNSDNRPAPPGMGEHRILRAIAARVVPATRALEEPSLELEPAGLKPVLPQWEPLLRYYAATQRLDPRGTVERFADEHGAKWQLISCAGTWWLGSEIEVLADQLPGAFREALVADKAEGRAAIGWPIWVLSDQAEPRCLPALLLPVRWQLSGAALNIACEEVLPVFNPTWAREARRRLGWSARDLEDALLVALEDSGDLGDVAHCLEHLVARIAPASLRPADLDQEVEVRHEKLFNAAALFLPDESSFTRAAARDLEQIATWGASVRRHTALAALLESQEYEPEGTEPAPLVAFDVLSDSQFDAAATALEGPLAAIQGPPGTGKSVTILNLVVSIVASGQSVLFASRNHRALDEVEERLGKIFPDFEVMVRGRDAEGERDADFLKAMRELAENAPVDPDAALAAQTAAKQLLQSAARQSRQRAELVEWTRLNLRLSELVDRAEGLRNALPETPEAPALGLLRRLLVWLAHRLRGSVERPEDPLPDGLSLGEVERRIVALRRQLASMPRPMEGNDAETADTKALAVILGARLAPHEETRGRLLARLNELDFQPRGARVRDLKKDDAQDILRHRPAWAVTSLAVPARIPLIPALFDYVIFDEASQCDIASSLPLLARARRGVIVGDPEQLTFVPGLSVAQEHALMDAVGLPRQGRAGLAQSRNSLFDFYRNWHGTERVRLLSDQFRSAPGIVDFISRAFYQGRLTPRRDENEFRGAGSYKPGIHWEDVKGIPRRTRDGHINAEEANWIVAQLEGLANDADFDGSVGVVAPFNAQVGLIRQLVHKRLPEETQRELSLRVGTIDSWQGGEADVVFFSLVVGPGALDGAINFLRREKRRFNVAVSRARAVAVVVGNLDWAKASGIAHLEALANAATAPSRRSPAGFESPWEERLYRAMRRRGLDPHPQYSVGWRRLDFALFQGDVKLDVEVDGRRYHTGAGGQRKTADRLRDRELRARGWKVRRFWVSELYSDMEGCVDLIERDLGRK